MAAKHHSNARLGADHWTTAFSATWEAGNTLPMLAFGNYVDRRDPSGPFGTCDHNYLYRPEGRHYGPPAPRLYTEADGWLTYKLWGMDIASRDLDGDGRVEVFFVEHGRPANADACGGRHLDL